MGVGQEALDKALAAESQHAVSNKDTTCTKMLMEKGASVSYNDGEALSIAVAAQDNSLTEILLSGKHRPSRSDTTRVFRILFTEEERTGLEDMQDSIFEIARSLLSLTVEQAAIDTALRVTLSKLNGSHHTEALIDLLLQYNADANTANGVCYVFAAQKHGHVFDKLMLHKPKFGIIVPALIGSKLHEEIVVMSVRSCFEHGCSPDELEAGLSRSLKTPVLVAAMQNYPRSEALVTILLDHGCNADIFVGDVIDPAVGEEMISALLWALTQPQKRISDSIITALLKAGASVLKPSPTSEIAPITLAAREARSELVHMLLERGADPSVRDYSNRSALFYASSISNISTVQALAPYALTNDGSLHEAARCIQLEAAGVLIKHGHNPNFPSRLHQGKHALGELCLHAHITTANQRSKVRQLIRLLLDNKADPKFKTRNEKSAVILALDNAYSALEIVDALLETEVWEDLNDERHLYRDPTTGLWYSPIKYVELIPSPSRAPHKQDLLELLRDKGCLPRFYSETAVQPPGAIGIPEQVKRLVDRQKEHELTLQHEQERHEHARTLQETAHRDALRRKKEQQDHDLAAQTHQHQHLQTLEQTTHEATICRVRDAERMKRGEKVTWHNLIMEQECDASARRQSMKDREAAGEIKLIEQRKAELEHRAGVERRMLKDKEDVYERNVKRQTEVMKRADESAQLHARLRQDRPAIEGAPQWGNVD